MSITVHGDLVGEVPLLWDEWILVVFSNPSGTAVLDTSFWGLGIAWSSTTTDAALQLGSAGAQHRGPAR